MKKKKTLSVLALTVIMVSCFALGAGASSAIQEVKAFLDPTITVKLEGEAQTFLDAKGTRIYPITYQGSTYLPVRAVAGLAGLDVSWDQDTRTVELGQTKGVDLIDAYKVYNTESEEPWVYAGQVQTAEGKTEDISGVSRSHWLYFSTGAFGTGKGYGSAAFNLLGKHDTLTFSYYSNQNVTLKVLGDNGSVLGEYQITGGAVAQTITLPLLKTNELKFEVSQMVEWETQVRIFDAYLDA